MDVQQALKNIKIVTSELAEEEILCIRRHKDEAIPVLLEYIKIVADLGKALPINYMAHHYAMYLLAEMKVRDALPYLIKFLEFDRHLTDNLLDDILTEDFGSILASVATVNDMPVIKSVIEDGKLDSFNRGAALSALKVFYTEEAIGRDEYKSYLHHLLETCHSDPTFLGDIICDCADAGFIDLLPLIKGLFKRKLVDIEMINIQDVKDDFTDSDEDTALQKLKHYSRHLYVKDAIDSVRLLIHSESKPESDRYNLLKKFPAFTDHNEPRPGLDAFAQYIRNNISKKPKKQKFSSTELMGLFKKEAQGRIPEAGVAYCDRLVSQALSDAQISDAVTGYAEKQRLKWGFDLSTATALTQHMLNYIAVTGGLLLSYSPPKDGQIQIPETYYTSLPHDFTTTLVAIPRHNILISAYRCADKAWYGSRQEKAGALLTFKVFRMENDWQLLYDGSFIDTHYPRFSLSCAVIQECHAYSGSDLTFSTRNGNTGIFRTECKMGPNRSQICIYEKELTNTFGVGLLGFLAILLMCYSRWQNRPMRIGTKKAESYPGMGVAYIASTPQWEHTSGGFREVQLREYPDFVKQMRSRGWSVENRSSPCEHERRGHMRTLKDGRMVFVRPSIVNKGGEKIVYLIE